MSYLLDPNISLKAKGIMATILNDGYESREKMLEKSTDGKASYQAGINELKKHGYIELVQTRDEKGFIEWKMNVLKK